MRINSFQPFREEYGFVAADDVLRFSAMMLNENVDQLGSKDDFIGHAGGDNFIVITSNDVAESIRDQIKSRFAAEILTHYNFMDREQGYITVIDSDGEQKQVALMTVGVGIVSSAEHQFADIREITELAAEARRSDG